MVRDDNDSYMEVILETGASIELAPKANKPDTLLLEQLKGETVKDRESNKFSVSVSYTQVKSETTTLWLLIYLRQWRKTKLVSSKVSKANWPYLC